ncbi:MAG TPA: hypothetical protein VHO48_11135 [Anaerolineaceae bacterium]|nr:hypothetical protein [Anaerolineaceae bacterium]
MDHGNHRYIHGYPRFYQIFIGLLLCALIAGCSFPPIISSPTPTAAPATPAPDTSAPQEPIAEYVFRVTVPDSTLPDSDVYLNVLDEVTGLDLNPTPYQMQPIENLVYEIKLPLPVGSVVKYRYSSQGTPPISEINAQGNPVRYRMAYVSGPGETDDIVTAWQGLSYSGNFGRITGMAVDQATQQGIPDILVTAGGYSTFTASDGSFLIENLPPGTHNIVAYSIDGNYLPFQQGALIAENSTTPASIALVPAARVNVQFTVTIPQENILNLPIRIAGNFYSTGNTYASLAGGVSTTASRMPLLNQLDAQRYSITLSLPVGAEFQYKYTLGDGFWNAEHTDTGTFRVRHFIVPDHDITVDDVVTTWRAGEMGPITVEVQAPADTPAEDFVSIQLNPFTWMEPIPMWALGNNRWMYVIYSPLNMMGSFSYRFCRDDQCGVADDQATAGSSAVGAIVQPGKDPQTLQSQISAWQGLTSGISPATITPSSDVVPRNTTFEGGYELQPNYHPSWQSRYPVTFMQLRQSGANFVVMTPSWTYTSNTPPVIQPVAGTDPLWADEMGAISQATAQGLQVAIFPTPHFSQFTAAQWWQNAQRDSSWWELWFARYQAFLLHHADLAAKSGAQALIVGGPWIAPAMMSGTLEDGSPSNVPTDADTRWRNMIAEIRSRFSGKILWAMDYPTGVNNPPSFLDAVDEIYLLWSAPLSTKNDPTEADLELEAANQFDAILYPFYMNVQKRILIAVGYPSIDGAAQGCIAMVNGGCAPIESYNITNIEDTNLKEDFQEQADLYQALLSGVNTRDWISGLISRGYYPPASMQDKSFSVHGKPAEAVLSFWFTQWTSPTQ